MSKQILTTHEILYKALIFSVNEGINRPIEGAFERIKGIWYFINSKNATIDGKEVEKFNRSLYVNPDLTSLSNKINFFEREVTFCGTRNNLSLSENDFISDFIKWIDKQLKVEGLPVEHERKYNDFKSYLFAVKADKKDNEPLNPQKHLSLRQIALKYIYENEKIRSLEDAKDILKQLGSKYKTFSKLFNHYTNLFEYTNRVIEGNDESRKKKNDMIKDMEIVLQYLEGTQAKDRCLKEISIIKESL